MQEFFSTHSIQYDFIITSTVFEIWLLTSIHDNKNIGTSCICDCSKLQLKKNLLFIVIKYFTCESRHQNKYDLLN